jgi:hypothetical protein
MFLNFSIFGKEARHVTAASVAISVLGWAQLLNYLPRAGVDISTHHSFPGPQHRPYMPGLFQAHYFYSHISIRGHGVSFTASRMQPPEMAAIVAAVWGKKHILQTQEPT